MNTRFTRCMMCSSSVSSSFSNRGHRPRISVRCCCNRCSVVSTHTQLSLSASSFSSRASCIRQWANNPRRCAFFSAVFFVCRTSPKLCSPVAISVSVSIVDCPHSAGYKYRLTAAASASATAADVVSIERRLQIKLGATVFTAV